MGLNVKLYNITNDGPYSIRYKFGANPYPEHDNTSYTLTKNLMKHYGNTNFIIFYNDYSLPKENKPSRYNNYLDYFFYFYNRILHNIHNHHLYLYQ